MHASLFASVPFAQHCVVDTSDFDEAHARICQALNTARFQVLRGRIAHNRLDLLPCGPVSLLRLRYGFGAEVGVDPGALEGYYLLVLPTRGQAQFHFDGRSLEVSPQAAVIVSPGRRFHFRASPDYEQILLRIERSAIDAAWHRLSAQDSARPICFEPLIPLQQSGWQALLPMLQWVVRCAHLGHGRGAAQAALLAQTESLLASTLLMHQPHDQAGPWWPALPQAAPRAVQRAQAYMLEHLGDALPVALVASHCGLSVRHLQALFKDHCGHTPLQWLRQQRLQAVRRALVQGGDGCQVGQTALEFGFTHLGEFSRAYRQAFGETPLQTRRSRGAAGLG